MAAAPPCAVPTPAPGSGGWTRETGGTGRTSRPGGPAAVGRQGGRGGSLLRAGEGGGGGRASLGGTPSSSMAGTAASGRAQRPGRNAGPPPRRGRTHARVIGPKPTQHTGPGAQRNREARTHTKIARGCCISFGGREYLWCLRMHTHSSARGRNKVKRSAAIRAPEHPTLLPPPPLPNPMDMVTFFGLSPEIDEYGNGSWVISD